ncbi:E3 SUMO-protein ligase PIAS3 [Geodia barretti]|uniref:E3 SUMO-protein ligase PIAS3 n=2 Tax=Geodia barretti TaxID=519541 RepID=A0AA35S2Q7_GEOBA|nr:E3 SUMO-protein ligase PIAS3 [Geodia barretti]
MKVKFHLTPQQIHQIYISKTSTGTYQTQVLVRFCLQETTCDQNDYYPKQCYVNVNSHNCPIAGYHPHLSTRPDYKRTGQPVNITNFVKTSPTEINEVTIFWAPDFMLPLGYCVGIEISKVVSSSDLLQGLKAKGVRSSDMSRALVKGKFTVDKDSEVAATSMKVSLLCPIGKMRMSYPCRTTSCTHLQCFDASIFYQMNEKRARWVCPVCDKPALPEDLFVDGLFMEICQNSPSSDTIIEFMADGSWKPSTETSGTCLNVDTPEKRGSSPISLDSSDGKRKSDIVVIDLTASSDKEDNGGTTQVDDEEEDEEEEEEERQERRRNTSSQRDVHSLTTERRGSEDADSDTGPSSNSSATVSASSPPVALSLQPSAFPRLSVALIHSDHAPSSSSHPPLTTSSSQSFTISLPTPSQASRRRSLTSPTSSARLHLSSSSAVSPADSQATTPTAASSSRPTSVIIEGRPHPSSNNNQDSGRGQA